MLVKFHYKQDVLQAVWVDADAVLTVQPEGAKGTEIFLKNGQTYYVHESVDDAAGVINRGRGPGGSHGEV